MISNVAPKPASLSSMGFDTPNVNFKKDARFLFQRLNDTTNTFLTASTGIELAASWSALPDATDGTKVTTSPRCFDVQWNETDKLENGEGVEGAPYLVGHSPQMVRAMFKNIPAVDYAALKEMESERTNLSFYRIDNAGLIGSRAVTLGHAGIKIIDNTFAVKNPSRSGSSADIIYDCFIEFYVEQDYYKDFVITSPASDFNPLYDIKVTPA
jgi:hypothetical protein